MKLQRYAGLIFAVILSGCNLDIFSYDNYDAPASTLAGRVVFEGQPLGVRNNEVQLELWQSGYQLNQKIPVYVHQDGTFTATLFDGSYKLNLLPGNGPWGPSADTLRFDLNGSAVIDVPVTPFYVIRDENVAYDPAGGGPTGSIRASFRLGQIVTSRALEYVGLYVGTTTFVDRVNSLNIPNAQRERSRAAILPQLNANGLITINVNLPANIYSAGQPGPREFVYVRIGVKTVGIGAMAFSPVYKIAI